VNGVQEDKTFVPGSL